MRRITFILFVTLLSEYALADERWGISASREFSDIGRIDSVYGHVLFKSPHSTFGAQLSTGISYSLFDNDFNEKEYNSAWEMAGRFGFFSDWQGYVEVGVDLGEFLKNGFESNTYDDPYHQEPRTSSFIGVGLGFSTDELSINAISRYRYLSELDSLDQTHWFTGVEVTFTF